MTTVVNNPSGESGSNAVGMMLGLILFLALAFLFFVYGLPMIRQSASPQINVPDKVDVNIQGNIPGNQ